MFHLVLIDWAGPVPFGEQMLVLRNIIALYLRRGSYDKRVNFTHLLIEGKLTFRGPTTFGMFSGNRFFVDLGTHNGSPWYCECLLPSSGEYVDLEEQGVIFAALPENDGISIREVDLSQGHATESNITE